MENVINIAKDFSATPAGRYRKYGQYTGEVFREDLLLPMLKAKDSVKIVLDGLQGVGASFWDEAFGAIIREGGFTKESLLSKINFVCDDDVTLVPTILSVLDEAEQEIK